MPGFDNYPHNVSRPPVSGSIIYDTAVYVRQPDVQFYRPWLANPGGNAFVWPLSIEGFSFSSNATTAIHHYIDTERTEVEVVYPDEFHISLTGVFPGRTAPDNVHTLRQVILESPDVSKILVLPLLFDQMQRVKVVNHSFTHDQSDFTFDISYSIEFIRTGVGSDVKLPVLAPWQPRPIANDPRGTPQRQFTTTTSINTARSIANYVYKDPRKWNRIYNKNKVLYQKMNIPPHKVLTTHLPPGTKVAY